VVGTLLVGMGVILALVASKGGRQYGAHHN
jgi:hypothetical protein